MATCTRKFLLILVIGSCFATAVSCRHEKSDSSAPPAPAQRWDRFRGPTGDGVAPPGARIADKLSLEKNLKWKVPVPAEGHSSPIVWGDRVFLTGQENRILAFDADTGELLWDRALTAEPAPPGGQDETPFEPGEYGTALSTPCTDGDAVYALFGEGIVGCVDFAGNQRWACRAVVRPPNTYGLSVSPVLYGELLILQMDLAPDEATEPPTYRSFLLALRKADGQEAWRHSRPVRDSWSSPLLLRHEGQDLLVTCAAPWVIAYDPATGRERWRAGGLAGDVVGSPVAAGGMVYAVGDPSGHLLAVRLGGGGDVTASHVAWTGTENLPEVVSPLCDGRRLFLIDPGGTLAAVDARDGAERWARSLNTMLASPVLLGDSLLLIDDNGILSLVSAADGTVTHQADLKETVTASPAIAAGRLYVRTAGHLMCIE